MPKWLSRGFNGASGACLNQHRRVGLVHAASCYSVLTENYYVLLQDAGSNFSCKEHGCHFLPVKCRTMKCFFHVHACDQVNLPCGKKDFYYAEMSGRIYWLCLVDDLDWILRSWSSENMTPCQKKCEVTRLWKAQSPALSRGSLKHFEFCVEGLAREHSVADSQQLCI